LTDERDSGVLGHQVLRSIENPNDVIVTHTYDSREPRAHSSQCLS
jgi:hypothetical protein